MMRFLCLAAVMSSTAGCAVVDRSVFGPPPKLNAPVALGDGSFEVSCDARSTGRCEVAARRACQGEISRTSEMAPDTASIGGKLTHVRNIRFWCAK